MLERFAKSAAPRAGIDWQIIIALVVQFLENCQQNTTKAVRSGNLNAVQRIRAAMVVRQHAPVGIAQAARIVDAMFDEAVEAQRAPAAAPGPDWCDQVAAEALDD